MLLARVRRTLDDRQLLCASDRRVLVACSGGPDSTALLHVLHRLRDECGFSLSVASVDHGIRPEAREELNAVRHLASGLGLPFVGLRVEVPSGSSLQGRARRERYRALRQAAEEAGASVIAVGHTRDDQAETVLARLLRGASVEGLSGIAPRRRDGVIRPLLDASRDEVLAYLDHHRLPYVCDPSNRDPRFLRVQVRHELLPLLSRADANLVGHLAALADDARATRRRTRVEALRLLEHISGPGGDLDRRALSDAPEVSRRGAIRVWVKRRTGRAPSRAQLLAMERAAKAGRGEIPLGRAVRAVASPDRLAFEAAPARFSRPGRAGMAGKVTVSTSLRGGGRDPH